MKTREAAASVCPPPPHTHPPHAPYLQVRPRYLSLSFITLILTSSCLSSIHPGSSPWRARRDFERTVATACLAVATQPSVAYVSSPPRPTDLLPLSSPSTLLLLAVFASLGSSKSELCPRTRSQHLLCTLLRLQPQTPKRTPLPPVTQPPSTIHSTLIWAFYSPLLSLHNRVVKVLLATLTPLPSLH